MDVVINRLLLSTAKQPIEAIGAGPIRVGDVGSDADGPRQPVVDVVIGIAGSEVTVDATVEDRADEIYQLLFGRNVLADVRIDVATRYDSHVRTRLDE